MATGVALAVEPMPGCPSIKRGVRGAGCHPSRRNVLERTSALHGRFETMTPRRRSWPPTVTLCLLAVAVAASPQAALAGTTTTTTAGAGTAEPVLITSVDTRSGGTGARLLLGDLTGDGRLDLVTMQPTYSAD